MDSEREIGIGMLQRLLTGERGRLPLHLAMLLESASSIADGENFYRSILPPELANLRLSPETCEEIINILCLEVASNPDEAFISAMSFNGSDLATKTVAMVLTNPP